MRIIDLGGDVSVYDLNHDGISEVVVVGVGSGQGTTSYNKSLVQFNGWTPLTLHVVCYGNNDGNCGVPEDGMNECESNDVSWKFEDLDGSGTDDLVEVESDRQGDKLKTKTSYYHFDGNKFISQSDYHK